jgi:putative oxidoreductase
MGNSCNRKASAGILPRKAAGDEAAPDPEDLPVTTASPARPATARTLTAARVVPWAAQVVVALILLQTLYFKFTYAPETRYIFADRGGRPAATLVGVLELVAAVLLLTGGRRAALGAVLALGLIGGAILTHLTSLGIVVKNPETGEGDGGLLFGLAVAVAVGSLAVLAYRWRQLPYADRLAVTSRTASHPSTDPPGDDR